MPKWNTYIQSKKFDFCMSFSEQLCLQESILKSMYHKVGLHLMATSAILYLKRIEEQFKVHPNLPG